MPRTSHALSAERPMDLFVHPALLWFPTLI